MVVSENGRDWRPLPTQALPGNRVQLTVTMPGPRLFIARVEPYRLSDLDRWLATLRKHRLVRITPIGQTVHGRPLEIVRVGRSRAPCRVFLRARAHPWESGGNWVVEGLIHRLLEGDADARKFLQRYCVYVLPMANKDGVARGLTRFNLQGMDLNRDWDRPADPQLAPENAALETWLATMIRAGQRPHLALELHNDGSGRLHVSRPPVPELTQHLGRMAHSTVVILDARSNLPASRPRLAARAREIISTGSISRMGRTRAGAVGRRNAPRDARPPMRADRPPARTMSEHSRSFSEAVWPSPKNTPTNVFGLSISNGPCRNAALLIPSTGTCADSLTIKPPTPALPPAKPRAQPGTSSGSPVVRLAGPRRASASLPQVAGNRQSACCRSAFTASRSLRQSTAESQRAPGARRDTSCRTRWTPSRPA